MNSDQPSRKKRRKLRVYHILIAIALAVVGGFVLLRWRLKSELENRIGAIRAAGHPATCVELDKWYSIPNDVENAADVILDAISCYEEPNMPGILPVVGEAELPKRTEALSEETKKAVREYLAENKQTLELLGQAAAIEHSRYPINLGDGFDASMPYLSEIRSVVRLLELDAVWHGEENEGGAAVQSAESIFGVGRSLEKEPRIVSQLVRIGCLAIAARAIERVSNRAELTDEQLVKMSRAVGEAEGRSGFERAFVGGRCAVLDVFRQPDSVDPQLFGRPGSMGVLFKAYRVVGLWDKGATIYIDLVDEMLDVLRLPEHERVEAAKAVQAKLLQIPRIHVMLHMLMPAYSRIVEISVWNTADLRVARVGLAIERYRLAAGKLPDKLDELIPAYLDGVPKDPFDGKELRYKRLETGFVVYSIGQDGSDDGGKEKGKNSGGNWDVTFIVER